MPDASNPDPQEHEEIHNEDFQFVLKALLAAYEPILSEDLRRAAAQPLQAVNVRDAEILLRTRFFRRAAY
jgi:hypothetical protein